MEKNNSHKGINIVDSTSILNNFYTVNAVYTKPKYITSLEIKSSLEPLIALNPNKMGIVFLDNTRTHTNILIQQFYQEQKYKLKLIFLPKHSPDMNPHQNIWNYLKDELNYNFIVIESLAYDKKFLVQVRDSIYL